MSFFSIEVIILILAAFLLLTNRQIVLSNSFKRPQTVSNNAQSNAFLLLCFLFLGFLIMFREENIGNDSGAYIIAYRQFQGWSDPIRFEPGYKALMCLSKYLSQSPYAIFAVAGLVNCLLYYFFIRRLSKIFFVSVLMFVFLSYFGQCMNTVRQSLAIGCVAVSFYFITRHEFIKHLIFILIAVSFHSSALIAAPLWWIAKIKLSRRNLIFLIISIISISVFFQYALNLAFIGFSQYESYVDSIFGEGGRIGAIFQSSIYVFLLVIELYVRHRIGRIRFRELGLEPLLVSSIIGCGLLIASYQMSIVGRMAWYFNVFQLILFPNILYAWKSKYRLILGLFALTVMNVYYVTIITLRPEWNEIFPYSTHLNF